MLRLKATLLRPGSVGSAKKLARMFASNFTQPGAAPLYASQKSSGALLERGTSGGCDPNADEAAHRSARGYEGEGTKVPHCLIRLWRNDIWRVADLWGCPRGAWDVLSHAWVKDHHDFWRPCSHVRRPYGHVRRPCSRVRRPCGHVRQVLGDKGLMGDVNSGKIWL